MRLVVATLHCNDRRSIFETIRTFLQATEDRAFTWVILAQGCSGAHNASITECLENGGVRNYEILVSPENRGWSRGMNTLYRYLHEQAYEGVLHLEDDWECIAENPKWLEECRAYLDEHPEVSTLFLRRYGNAHEKWQYGWSRSIWYNNFKFKNAFHYGSKIVDHPEISYRSLVLRRIPEFLYSANPTILRLDDYMAAGVFPFPELQDRTDRYEAWGATTLKDAAEWGCAEALTMEKIRHLTCMNVDRGYFQHSEAPSIPES